MTTQAEIRARLEAVVGIVRAGAPLSVRHVFYVAVGMALVPKSDAGYHAIARDVLRLRRSRRIGYRDIVDGTRQRRGIRTWDGLDDALKDVAGFYRRDLWNYDGPKPEVWAESDSIAGTLEPVTDEWQVPLCITRGYASETFLYNCAQSMSSESVVLYVGDHDRHGKQIERHARKTLGRFGHRVEWRRLAITPEQVEQYQLPSDYGHAGNVQAEALPADEMRRLLHEAIEAYADQEQLAILRAAEDSEREILYDIVETARGAS
jgi:hypothetical protein